MTKRLWTDDEIVKLKRHELPEGRSLHAAYTKAHKLGLCFHPKFEISYVEYRENAKAHRQEIIDEARRTGNIRATGRKFGVSYTTVAKIVHDAGVKTNPGNIERRGECLEFEGRHYVWSEKQGYWRCTSGNRHSLQRLLYERAFGPIQGHKVVQLKDGNRYNLDAENLVCRTVSEQMRHKIENPIYKALALGCLARGRLVTQIAETVDPELKQKRIMKAVQTRQAKRRMSA